MRSLWDSKKQNDCARRGNQEQDYCHSGIAEDFQRCFNTHQKGRANDPRPRPKAMLMEIANRLLFPNSVQSRNLARSSYGRRKRENGGNK
jgi:hypothetical protein